MTGTTRWARRYLHRRQEASLEQFGAPLQIAAFHAVAELCIARVALLRLVPIYPAFGSSTVLLQFAKGQDILALDPLACGVEELACCAPATAVPYHCSQPGRPILICFESPRGLILLTCAHLMLDSAPGESGNPVERVDHFCPA